MEGRKAAFVAYLLQRDATFPAHAVPPVPYEVSSLRFAHKALAPMVALLEHIIFCCADAQATMAPGFAQEGLLDVVCVALWMRTLFYKTCQEGAMSTLKALVTSMLSPHQPAEHADDHGQPLFNDMHMRKETAHLLKMTECMGSTRDIPKAVRAMFPHETFEVMGAPMWLRLSAHVAYSVQTIANVGGGNIMTTLVLRGFAMRLVECNQRFSDHHCGQDERKAGSALLRSSAAAIPHNSVKNFVARISKVAANPSIKALQDEELTTAVACMALCVVDALHS